jgi:hypothetical protein
LSYLASVVVLVVLRNNAQERSKSIRKTVFQNNHRAVGQNA